MPSLWENQLSRQTVYAIEHLLACAAAPARETRTSQDICSVRPARFLLEMDLLLDVLNIMEHTSAPAGRA